jgi:hypothetical protein
MLTSFGDGQALLGSIMAGSWLRTQAGLTNRQSLRGRT